MTRRRLHDPDAILDAAERLVVDGGRGALTVRALTRETGASNGAIYHEFGSVEAVVARAWLRRARQFLTVQRQCVQDAWSTTPSGRRPVAAVVAAADAVAVCGIAEPVAAQLLTRIDRDAVLVDGLPDDLATELRALDSDVTGLMRELADSLWGRWDSDTASVMFTCLVRLPAALLFPSLRAGRVDPLARAHLRAAVEAALAVPIPHHDPDPASGGHRA